MRLIKRLLFDPAGTGRNLLVHPFFLVTLAYGLAFVFFPSAPFVTATILYQLTLVEFGGVALSTWGASLLGLTVLNTTALLFNKYALAKTSAMIGVTAWFYTFLLFALGGFWLQVLVHSLANMYFWIWYYFKISEYQRAHKAPID